MNLGVLLSNKYDDEKEIELIIAKARSLEKILKSKKISRNRM